MKNKSLKLVFEGDMEMDYDIWMTAYQQACAIAFNKEFKDNDEYLEYIVDLAESLYTKIIRGEL